MEGVNLVPYAEHLRPGILMVWERSVTATHHFLGQADFMAIKEEVQGIHFQDFEVYCLLHGDAVSGFLGVADRKIEMLFMDPAYRRQGHGAQLLRFAVESLQAIKLDVNAQNTDAVAFYEAQGFEKYELTDKDDQGRDYPLWRMRLAEKGMGLRS
jgi:putative acetyltransferase